jgi:hypothetical protein
MKKILLIVMLWTMVLPSVIAQDSVVVKFMVEIPKEQKLTAQQSGELKDKMEAVLGRMDAYADASEYVLAASVKMTGTRTSEGGMRPYTVAEGELSLKVHNKKNGTIVNATTLKLQDSFPEGEATDVLLRLIRAIKVRDSRFVRFIHTSQNRIQE